MAHVVPVIVPLLMWLNVNSYPLIPSRSVWAKNRILSRKVFASRLSWRRAVLLVSGTFWHFRLYWVAMEGRTFARAVAMWVAVSFRLVAIWPMEMQPSSTRP